MTQASMARSLREIANALESGPWVHQGEQSTHLMFVKIGILEVHLHKGWKCHSILGSAWSRTQSWRLTSLKLEPLDMAVISSRLFPLLKPMASRPFTSRSLLKKPTPSFKDCSLTMDLYQNFGLFPTSHSVLLTRTRLQVCCTEKSPPRSLWDT